MFIGSAQNTTLLPPSAGAPEHYEELWWYSGSSTSQGGLSSASSNNLVSKGSTGTYASTNSGTHLHTLSSGWPATTKFSFEATLWTTASSAAAYAALWDITSNVIVSASQISTTATTATVLRSGQFTLTQGHVFGIAIWSQDTVQTTHLLDASLIVFPQ